MRSYKKRPGEVAAISGYEFQYSIFATEIYNALLNDSSQLEWIEFASDDAGKLDDVLIGLKKSILAFQIKNIGSSSFSYNTLITNDTQSILKGMFLGWEKIKSSNSNKEIDIRFITTQSASENDKIESSIGKVKPSFIEFVNNLWIPIKKGKYDNENLPAKWTPVLQELATLIETSVPEFLEFVKCTTFVFEYSIPKSVDSYIERQRRIDIEDITKNIFQTIARKGNIRLNKKEFLDYFGLSNRYESYYTHSFFVDENHYQPINETIDQLEELIKGHSKGYISLIGNAGSGKSTLLTKWLQNTNYRILKYYAYVNTDMSYQFGFRGEAKTFLHDLLVQIRQARYSSQDRLPTTDFEDLQKHFNNELNKLSREEEKVIIIVDGLDHIEREQDVSKSLIGVLPLPDSIPNNVYFLLGSRTIENLEKLNTRIKQNLIDENRVVNMKVLSKAQIQAFLNSYSITLQENLFEQLYVNTKGHPLFLRYTIEEIRNGDKSNLEEIITQRVFSGDIYIEYKVFWDVHKYNDDFIEILGILSRHRQSFFNIELLNAFPKITSESQHKVNKLSENYFFKIGNTWQFFHNSFKEFLISETARNILTRSVDHTKDKAFHLKISDAIENLQDEYKWNRIYHLYKADEFGQITQIATQTHFRKQWFEFRSYKLIKEDIQLSINASAKLKDIYCLFRCFLSLFEIKQRYINFDPSGYFETFHKLGKVSLANSFVYNNVELLVPQKTALDYSLALYAKGYEELSYDVFLRATPSYILNQSKSLNPRKYIQETFQEIDEVELIKNWAKAASLFTPLENILSKIKEMKVEDVHESREERDLYPEMLSAILDINIQTENWENLKRLEELIVADQNHYDPFYFYFEIASRLSSKNEFYNHCIQVLKGWEVKDNNPINRRLLIVSLIVTRDIESAKPIFSKLLLPNKIERPDYSLKETDFLNYIFDYSRFFYITTKDFSTSPSSFLPTTDKHTKIAFYHAFAELGKSYAYIYHNYANAAIGYYSSFENFMKLFHYGHTEYGYDYSISEDKPLLINLILDITSKISNPVFNEMLSTLDKEWHVNKVYWSTKHIQEIIEWVSKSGLNNSWCINQLEKIDAYNFEKGYLEDRIERGIKQINLWCGLDLKDKGEAILNRIMDISLDIRGEKDNQLDYIVGWISIVDSSMSEEIDYYLKRINFLRDKVNSRSHTPSSEILTLSLKHGNSFEVFKYLLFQGLVDFGDSIDSILNYLLSSLPNYRRVLVKLFTRIVIAYDNTHYARQTFLNKLFESPHTFSFDELSELICEISIYSVSEHRNDYLFQVQEYAIKKGIDLDRIGLRAKIEIKDRYTEKKSEELSLDDGSTLSMSALVERIKSKEQLNEIQKASENDRNFNWAGLNAKVFKNLSDSEILEMLDKGRGNPREVVSIVEGLIEKNRIEIARNILYNTIHNGEKYGWVTFYDGGSKIAPFELLNKIEEKGLFQHAIINDFSNSIASLDVQAIEALLKDAPKIWKYFSDDTKMKELYEEVICFRNELLKTHPIDNQAPSVKGTMDNDDLIVEVIFFILTLPSDFNYSLYEIFVEEYSQSKGIINKILRKLLNESYTSKYIKLLAILNSEHKGFAIEHKEEIIKLLNHRRYDISRIASRILADIGINTNDYVTVETKDIPLAYNMEFEYQPSIHNVKDLDLEHINKKGFLKETVDPLVYVKLYLAQIKVLSEVSGIGIVNIAYRIMSLGKDLEFPSWCDSISEEELRKIYSARFDLEISYKRPRNQLVWDGLMKVVKELYELDLIDVAIANEISDEFDENAYLIETNPKPGFIFSILEEPSKRAPSASKGWAGKITDEYLTNSIKFNLTSKSLILGEYTFLRGMGWGYAEEIRQGFIDLKPKVVYNSDREIVFNMTSDNFVNEYPEIQDKGIILYNGLLTMNKKRNWLAINPSLCKDLDLVFNSHEGSFRWDDREGNKIVESIYWQTHSVDNYSRKHDSEAGYGWYVILHEKGYDIFKELIGDRELYYHRKVSRVMEYNSSRHKEELGESFSKQLSERIVL